LSWGKSSISKQVPQSRRQSIRRLFSHESNRRGKVPLCFSEYGEYRGGIHPWLVGSNQLEYTAPTHRKLQICSNSVTTIDFEGQVEPAPVATLQIATVSMAPTGSSPSPIHRVGRDGGFNRHQVAACMEHRGLVFNGIDGYVDFGAYGRSFCPHRNRTLVRTFSNTNHGFEFCRAIARQSLLGSAL